MPAIEARRQARAVRQMQRLRRELRELQQWRVQAQPVIQGNKGDIAQNRTKLIEHDGRLDVLET